MPSITVGADTVEYEEDAERSPVCSFSHGQSRVERVFIVPWAKWGTFVHGMLGYPRIKSNPDYLPISSVSGSGGDDRYNKRAYYVSRALPHAMQYPLDVSASFGGDPADEETSGEHTWLYAVAASRVEPLGATGLYDTAKDMPLYTHARVTLLYEPLTYKIRPDEEMVPGNTPFREFDYESAPYEFHLRRYITRTVRPIVEYLSLPRGRMKWVHYGDNYAQFAKPVDYATAIPVPAQEIVYTWHQVPFIPQALRTHIGSVNLNTFKDHNRLYHPGTLLLLGAEIKPYRMATGKFVCDIAYRVKYFNPFRDGRGHNYFLRFSQVYTKLLFLKITDNGNEDLTNPVVVASHPDTSIQGETGNPIFPYADFQELFAWKCADSRARLNKIPPGGDSRLENINASPTVVPIIPPFLDDEFYPDSSPIEPNDT